MKKTILFLLVSVMLLTSCLPLTASAALTDAQKNTLIAYTDRFLEDGNATGKLQYGIKEVWRTYQGFFSFNNEVYTTTADGKRQKILYMMNPKGYRNYDQYLAEISGGKGGYLEEGEYMALDCSAFVAWIYKAVFGLRFDYVQDNTVRNWSTLHYMHQNYSDLRMVRLKNGKNLSVLKEIHYKKVNEGTISLASVEKDVELEVGDILVGRNENTGWGHVIFYGGDGYVYHSSSTPQTLPDGSLNLNLMRKQLLSELTNESYTVIRIYRINDGILPEDFAGYNVPFDFSKSNAKKTPYDTTPPAFTVLEVAESYSEKSAGGVKSTGKVVTVKVTDEFGTDPVLYLSSDRSTVMKGSAYGESGVLGVYTNQTGVLEGLYDFPSSKKTDYEYFLADGTYYFWVRDAAENVSQRYTVTIGETSTVTRKLADGSEEEIATYGEGKTQVKVELTSAKETTAAPKPAESSEPSEETTAPAQTGAKNSDGVVIAIASAAVAIVLVAAVIVVSKKKK